MLIVSRPKTTLAAVLAVALIGGAAPSAVPIPEPKQKRPLRWLRLVTRTREA